jgi:hypothetical protein
MKLSTFPVIILMIMSSLIVAAQPKGKVEAEKLFAVHERGQYMTKVEVRKEVKGTENIVQIEALNVSGGSALIRGEILPGADISTISPVQGSYNMTRQISKSGRGMTLQLLDVIFPFRVRVTISDQVLDLEIKEAGFWKVSVGLTQ